MTSQIKSRIGQGRVGIRRKKSDINQPIAESVEHTQKIPEVAKIVKKVINIPSFAPLCNQ